MSQEMTIRQLNPDDWERFRDLRLEALRQHPEAFCPSRDETQFGKPQWVERLSNPNGAHFGLYRGDQMVGLTGIVRDSATAAGAHLVGSYIRVDARSKGFARLFYEARIAWAKSQPGLKFLEVQHREDNHASRGAHQRFGFIPVDSKTRRWGDGREMGCQTYRLDLGGV